MERMQWFTATITACGIVGTLFLGSGAQAEAQTWRHG